MVQAKSYSADKQLSMEFNSLLQDVATDVIDSTALRTLEKTTSTLRKELPHLEKSVQQLNYETNSLKETNRKLDKVDFNELSRQTLKINKTLDQMETKINRIEKEQKALKTYQDNIVDNLEKSLASLTTTNQKLIMKYGKELNDGLIETYSRITRNFIFGLIGLALVFYLL